MNRRDFLRLMPGLAALPLVGRWLREDAVNNGSISLEQWQQFGETFVGDEPLYNPPVTDTSSWVKNLWYDECDNLCIETWDGEITTKRIVRNERGLSVEHYRMNAAGEWELTD